MKELLVKCRKQISIWYVLFSTLFSAMVIVSRHIFYNPDGNSTVETAYVTDFHLLDFLGILLLIPVVYLAMKVITYVLQSASERVFGEKRSGKVWMFAVFFLVIFILWIPYLPSYWPGGIYADTVDSINMALGKAQMDNHNPILYTLIWRFMFWITGAFNGEGEYGGLKLFTVIQTVMLALALAGFVYYLYKKGVHKTIVFFLLLVFALFPLYPFYGISMWKDTIFSLVVFLFSLYLYHVFSQKPEDISWKQLAGYSALTILIMFLRNNGIYMALFYSIVIVLMCLKKQRRIAVKIGTASLVVIAVSGIIQGPVFDKCGYNIDRSVESFGIPLQQTAYIYATDGNLGEEDLEVLNEIMPLENWKALYNPVVADTIKFDPSFNKDYFEENTDVFLKTYLNLVIKNPVKAVKAYFLETMGFWNVFESSSTAYICNFHFGNVEYFMSDYFDYYFHISFRNMVEPKDYISAAVFVWMMLAAICICLAKRFYAGIIPMLPTLGLWLSIMVATPVAFSFRYVYAVFLCAPLYVIISVKALKK